MAFQLGHLEKNANTNFIYKKKPNNMGIPLGEISNYNSNKGYITLKLQDTISIGDTISIDGETGTYTVSELLINNKNSMSANQGAIVKLGRMKGNINSGNKVYKISDKQLSTYAISSYSNCENRKIPLNCKIDICLNKPIILSVSSINTDDSFYNDINFKISSSIIPEKALNNPVTEERIIKQISKTSNTPYEFRKIEIHLENNLFIPKISELNELRRKALKNIENIIKEKYCNNQITSSVNLEYFSDKSDNTHLNNINEKEISVLLNNLNINFNYSDLKNVTNIYIPFKFFLDTNYSDIITKISNKFNLYIYMPLIIRKNYSKLFSNNIENLLSNYNIKGFVISNISNLSFLENLKNKYSIIGNYTLNMFNDLTFSEYQKLGLDKMTLSPELHQTDILSFKNINFSELIVYGKTPIMNMNYCLLGKANHCYKNCEHKCNLNSEFYLKDRLGFIFRVIPDNIETVTTIYNSKITSISTSDLTCKNLRLDILDEDIEKINEIINIVLSEKKLEGKEFTNGNFTRFV